MNRDSFKRVGFSEQKLALLASLLDEGATQIEQRRGITRRENTHEYPLSAGQRRMWFLDQFEQGVHYNENFNLRLKGAADIAILERTLQEILRRHEAMRSSFVVRDGQPVQRIMPTAPIRLPVTDLRGIPELDQQGEAVRLAVEEARRPFDLAKGPLWRFTFLLLAEDEGILLITAHHIATDGWSFGVFLKEFRLLYEAFRAGEPSPLSDPVVQYADYAAWQTEWLSSEAAQQQLSYWTRHLSGTAPLLELPADRPRPSIQTFRGARHQLTLSKPLTAAVRDLSHHLGVTLFMSLLATFQALISRYTGRDDIVIGTPIANRTLPEIEGLIGYFVNTLVLRSDLSGDPTFVDLLQQVRQTTLSGFQNQDLPLEKLVDALRPQRTQSYTPLFQVLFVLQNLPKHKWDLPHLSVSPFRIDSSLAKFDLTLFLFDRADGLTGWIEYATDLFDAARIERMAGHFLAMLEGIVSNPNERLSRLPLLTGAERQQLLVDWNDTQVDYPANACIHELFEAQAERTPEAVAVEFEGSQLCYRELNERANQLAHYLRGMGVGPESFVGVCLERSPEAVVGLLGTLKAGAAFVPLDPGYPRDRLAFMIADAQIPLVVSRQKWLPVAGVKGARVVCLDSDHCLIEAQETDNLPSAAGPASVAYVLYTSGSTGVPKGVLGLHRGAVNRFAWMWKNFPFESGEVCCLKTSFNFVDSIWEVFGPLLRGIPIVIISDQTVHDPAELVRTLAAHAVTRIVTVPSLLRTVLDGYPDLGNRLPLLKLWVSSGEALLPDLCRRFYAAMPNATLLNLYGSTEVAADVTAHVACPAPDDQGTVPLGRPIDNTRLYVLDGQLQPVPMGVQGELLIGGEGLARGYLNRRELTAEKFIADPFSTDAESRLYRTGDLVRYRADGALEFLGRIDQQVKIRGFRIELGEIEDALRQHPGVREAVVVVREEGEKQLVAYVVAAGEPACTSAELRDYLKQKLPDYMVPAAWVALPALPLTANGKVDRKALPAPDTARPAHPLGFVAPRTETEKKLARWWAEILGLERTSIHDNFFELGGHSLRATQLISRIRTGLCIDVPLRSLFERPTVARFSEYIEAIRWTSGESTSSVTALDTTRTEVEL